MVLANSTLKVVAYCVSREDCKEWIVNDGYGSFTSPTGSHAMKAAVLSKSTLTFTM